MPARCPPCCCWKSPIARSSPAAIPRKFRRGSWTDSRGRGWPPTADQWLSWPTEAQMNGADGGVYFASVQLFLHDLLDLKSGPEKLRALVTELPDHLNWQTSFFDAFRDDFKPPLEVEKWWALR